MPYTEIKKEGDKYCFRNKETRQRICSDSKQMAVAAMRARYWGESKKAGKKSK